MSGKGGHYRVLTLLGGWRIDVRQPLASGTEEDLPARMSLPNTPPLPFTLAERAWLRQELGVHFGAGPQIADGLFLRSWKSGPEKGKPKLPPAARSMLDRGLIEIRPARIGYAGSSPKPGSPPYASSCSTHAPWTQAGLDICESSWA